MRAPGITRLSRCQLLAWVSVGVAIAGASIAWHTRFRGDTQGTTDLLGPLYSEEPLLHRTVTLEERRFEGAELLEAMVIGGATSRLKGRDLELLPQTGSPRLVFRHLVRANRVSVELQTPVSGRLRIFWAGGMQAFSQARMLGVEVTATDSPATVKRNISAAVETRVRPFRLRIDPIDSQVPILIRSVTLSRVAHLPEEPATGRVGKVALDEETREAVALLRDGWTTNPLQLHSGDQLAFGLARSPYNLVPTRLVVRFVSREGEVSPVFTWPVEPKGRPSWVDHRVGLDALAGRAGHFVFEAEARGSVADGLLFISSPKVVPARRSPRPNLILISLDTVGAAHLRRLEQSGASRFFSRMRREGLVFENAHANSSLTHSSHASLLTGRFPPRTGAIWISGGVGKCPTLASLLREHGYVTIGVTGGVLVTAARGFARGFELFREEDTLFKDTLECEDVKVGIAFARRQLAGLHGHPFFLFLHSYDAHGPYYADPDHSPSERASAPQDQAVAWAFGHVRGRLALDPGELGDHIQKTTADGGVMRLSGSHVDGKLIRQIERTYEGEIAHLDRQLDRFLAALEEEGLLENSVVVVTADHGEAFLEHGLVEHGLLYEENLHVPLFIRGPGRVPQGVAVRTRVDLIDVLPTLLELLGLPAPAGFDGRSLVPRPRGQPLAARRSYAFTIENGFAWYSAQGEKWILRTAMQKENFGHSELFRLDRDPAERSNLLLSGSTVPPSLRAFAWSGLKALPGLHLSLETFAGAEVRIRLPGTEDTGNPLYGWDMALLGPAGPEDARQPRTAWEARLGSQPHIVLTEVAPVSPFSVEVRTASNQVFSFAIAPDALVPGERLSLASRGRTILVWRVSPETEVAAVVPADRLEKLRALGYAQ